MTHEVNNNSFGFETSKFHSTFSHKEEIGEVEGCIRENVTKEPSNAYVQRNIRKVVGYIPVLGIFAGIGTIKESVNYKDQPYKALHILRAAAQIIGLGSLFLIPDLAKTYFNYRQVRKEENNLNLLGNDEGEIKEKNFNSEEIESIKSIKVSDFFDKGKILSIPKKQLTDKNEKLNPAWLKQAILFYGANFLSVKRSQIKYLKPEQAIETEKSLKEVLKKLFSSNEFKKYEKAIERAKDEETINSLTKEFYNKVLPKYFNENLNQQEALDLNQKVTL